MVHTRRYFRYAKSKLGSLVARILSGGFYAWPNYVQAAVLRRFYSPHVSVLSRIAYDKHPLFRDVFFELRTSVLSYK